MKNFLLATLVGLSMPVIDFAPAAPSAKPAKPAEDEALKKAIDAVNREVEKTKKPDATTDKSGKPAEPAKPAATKPPASKPPAAKPTPEKPAPEKPAPEKPAPEKPAPEKPAPPPSSSARPANPPAAAGTTPSQPPTTRITSEEDVDFRNKEGLIHYRKNVLVDRPDLKIWCDELQISLNQQTVKKVEPPPADPPPTKKPADDSDGFSAQNVKEALAKAAAGGFVVIWRKTLKGEIVAMAREALYDGASGNITLKGVPEVLRDQKLHISSGGEADKLLLMKNGNVKGDGANRTAMVQENEGRDVRKRILGHAPVHHSGSAVSGPSPTATPPSIPPTVPQ